MSKVVSRILDSVFAWLFLGYAVLNVLALVLGVIDAIRQKPDPRFEGERLWYRS